MKTKHMKDYVQLTNYYFLFNLLKFRNTMEMISKLLIKTLSLKHDTKHGLKHKQKMKMYYYLLVSLDEFPRHILGDQVEVLISPK